MEGLLITVGLCGLAFGTLAWACDGLYRRGRYSAKAKAKTGFLRASGGRAVVFRAVTLKDGSTAYAVETEAE